MLGYWSVPAICTTTCCCGYHATTRSTWPNCPNGGPSAAHGCRAAAVSRLGDGTWLSSTASLSCRKAPACTGMVGWTKMENWQFPVPLCRAGCLHWCRSDIASAVAQVGAGWTSRRERFIAPRTGGLPGAPSLRRSRRRAVNHRSDFHHKVTISKRYGRQVEGIVVQRENLHELGENSRIQLFHLPRPSRFWAMRQRLSQTLADGLCARCCNDEVHL